MGKKWQSARGEMSAAPTIRKAALTHHPVPLAIIGGGAAGLFAAAAAARRRMGCLVFERKARIGSKLLMTANGRCNFTKDISAEQMLADIGEPVASFVAPALRHCPPSMIAAGFMARGLAVKRRADGCLFPASERAADVVHVFGDLLRDNEIPLLTNCAVTGLQPMKNGFIVATRQAFASALGLQVEPCRAGLVGCATRDRRILARAGARYMENASAAVVVEGRRRFFATGEVEFEPWGLSGAAVYNCTRWVARHLSDSRVPWGLELDIDGERLSVEDPMIRPVKEAIVTMGGVSLAEVDPETMMSRKVPGLYFAGEVLDIDGPTGGYNLSLAFATAHLAVENMV